MPEYVLKYADERGQIRQESAQGASEAEIRARLSQQGYLIYSIREKSALAAVAMGGGRRKLDLERFLIFNQQFVTLIRAGLPILKSLDLLADRLTDKKLRGPISAVRDEIRTGVLLSDAFGRQGIFPPIYVTSVMAGEKAGSLGEVLERFITYQRLVLSARKKLMLSLIYPSVLVTLVLLLVVFLVTYVVPSFAQLYSSTSATLPEATQLLISISNTAREYIWLVLGAVVAAVIGFRVWSRSESAQVTIDRIILRSPIVGEIWVKFQVAQFARVLSTLLVGGIPLVQALETAGDSSSSRLIRRMLDKAKKMIREGQPLSASLSATGVFPGLAVDMVEVGESTGALASMLNSVAEFYEDDVQTRMTAVLGLIEPAIMVFMGVFVGFVLIALYLPIFSLADTLK